MWAADVWSCITSPDKHAGAAAVQIGHALLQVMLCLHPGVLEQAISKTEDTWLLTDSGLLVRLRSLHQSGRSSKIVHRLAVFDKSGDVQHIISQSDVIRCETLNREACHVMAPASSGNAAA